MYGPRHDNKASRYYSATLAKVTNSITSEAILAL